ncbi:MAG: GNAT family N-acetyltransferase [Flavobacteriales bacterium]|jgi:RimJ/RimL family protein N-acetyltransferase|nr:GNAT family N-acetyltransferase [Flavobacteriales bacterium]
MDFNIREIRTSDLDDLVKYANNANIADNLTDRFPYPYSRKDGEEFIEMVQNNTTDRIFAITTNDHLIGTIGLHPQSGLYIKNVELGYWVAEPFWGKGIATGAVRKILEYAFENLDVDRVFAKAFGSNIGSQKVLTKNGFRLEACFPKTLFKDGEYYDDMVFGFRREQL